jgi:spore cortex biosynthesis protein YabQ
MGLETFFTTSEQTKFFLQTCIMGLGLGVIFDMLRVSRIIFTHTKVFVAVEDIAFVLIWGLSLFVFSTMFCRGEVRFFYFVGTFIGFVLYIATVGSVVVGVTRRFVLLIKRVLSTIYSFTLAPIVKLVVFIGQKLHILFVRFHTNFKNNCKQVKISLTHKPVMMYNQSTHQHKAKSKVRKKIRKQKRVAKVEAKSK